MGPLPPGTLLQLMYLRERLSKMPSGRFVEIGPGAGDITNVLLEMGWKGEVFDLEIKTVDAINSRFRDAVEKGALKATQGNWLDSEQQSCDLVISCMVLEHFDDSGESQFIKKAKDSLLPSGTVITIVPGSMEYWGIEDEIAGHYRRYSHESIKKLMTSLDLQVNHIAGLTYPLSNLLYPVSNFLVRRAESQKLTLGMEERTKQSGIRDVAMKTKFPSVFSLILNPISLYPLHFLQKVFSRSPNAMVIYVEAKK